MEAGEFEGAEPHHLPVDLYPPSVLRWVGYFSFVLPLFLCLNWQLTRPTVLRGARCWRGSTGVLLEPVNRSPTKCI